MPRPERMITLPERDVSLVLAGWVGATLADAAPWVPQELRGAGVVMTWTAAAWLVERWAVAKWRRRATRTERSRQT